MPIRAEIWRDLVLPPAEAGGPSFTVIAVHDPRHHEPLLLASPLPVPAPVVHDLYHDRWPVEQLPLAAKQMLGAARQFVSAPSLTALDLSGNEIGEAGERALAASPHLEEWMT
jgi:hypothetical protein